MEKESPFYIAVDWNFFLVMKIADHVQCHHSGEDTQVLCDVLDIQQRIDFSLQDMRVWVPCKSYPYL